MITCKRCWAVSVRRSHLRWSDALSIAVLRWPYRCLRCRFRFRELIFREFTARPSYRYAPASGSWLALNANWKTIRWDGVRSHITGDAFEPKEALVQDVGETPQHHETFIEGGRVGIANGLG